MGRKLIVEKLLLNLTQQFHSSFRPTISSRRTYNSRIYKHVPKPHSNALGFIRCFTEKSKHCGQNPLRHGKIHFLRDFLVTIAVLEIAKNGFVILSDGSESKKQK